MPATHETRDHPTVERLPNLPNAELWAYIEAEIEYLSTPEQRRVPTPLAAAVSELVARHRTCRGVGRKVGR